MVTRVLPTDCCPGRSAHVPIDNVVCRGGETLHLFRSPGRQHLLFRPVTNLFHPYTVNTGVNCSVCSETASLKVPESIFLNQPIPYLNYPSLDSFLRPLSYARCFPCGRYRKVTPLRYLAGNRPDKAAQFTCYRGTRFHRKFSLVEQVPISLAQPFLRLPCYRLYRFAGFLSTALNSNRLTGR